jgi:AraC-like DNA-binding protein
MAVANYVKDHSFKIYQPLFKNSMENYEQQMVFSPSQIFFYHFYMPRTYLEETVFICVPDGCVDIIFIYDENRCMMEMIGSTLRRKVLKSYPGHNYFGLRLKPGMFMSTNDVSLAEVTDNELLLNMSGPELSMFAEKLVGLSSLDEKTGLFLASFGDALTDSHMPDPVQYMLWKVNAKKGNVSVKGLAEEMNYSERQIRRLMYDSMNISPKMLCRIVRFQNALHSIINERQPQIGLDCVFALNYADQPHFQREFKEFTGMSPRKFLEEYRKG